MGPQPEIFGSTLPWLLTNRGLEVNLGDIELRASNGASLSFKSYTKKSKIVTVNPGTPDSPGSTPALFSTLTGSGLKIGTTESLVWEVNTHYSYVKYPQQTGSDRRIKENILPIVEAKQYVMSLQPVTYDLIFEEGFMGDSANLRNKAGFIAQDVLDILPGAVGYMEAIDRYTLDYTYFIPYLTRTVQEQEDEIQNLREQLQASKERIEKIEAMLEGLGAGNPENGNAPGTMSTGGHQGNGIMEKNVHGMSGQNSQTESAPLQQNGESGADNEGGIGARLWQNVPNPANGNTVIRYELPAHCKGRIVLTSGSGQTVKVFDLSNRAGTGEIEVNGQSLNAGVYSYSLVVNGRSVDTKRMVLNR